MEAEGSRMAARKKAGGQTPEPTNRNHIGCSCGILPVAALLEFIGYANKSHVEVHMLSGADPHWMHTPSAPSALASLNGRRIWCSDSGTMRRAKSRAGSLRSDRKTEYNSNWERPLSCGRSFPLARPAMASH